MQKGTVVIIRNFVVGEEPVTVSRSQHYFYQDRCNIINVVVPNNVVPNNLVPNNLVPNNVVVVPLWWTVKL